MTSVARHPKNRLYIDSGASLHILFNKELMGELYNTDKPQNLQIHITLYVIQGLMTQYMYRVRMTVNTYNFNETINVTYIT